MPQALKAGDFNTGFNLHHPALELQGVAKVPSMQTRQPLGLHMATIFSMSTL